MVQVRTILSLILFLSGHLGGKAWLAPIRLSSRITKSTRPGPSPRHFNLCHAKSHKDGFSMLKMSRSRKIEKPRSSRFNLSRRRVRILAAAFGLGLLATLVYPRAAAAAISTASQAASSSPESTAAAVAPALQTPAVAAPLVAAAHTPPPPMVAVGAWGGNAVLPRFTELKLSIRLLYASLLGSVVGWERSASNHSAGVRTMALVSLGAAAFTICSMYGFIGAQNFDPSRMASSVASGVGFIGGGVITTHNMQRGNASQKGFPQSVVHGLTTAAAIWLSAAVGVASGVGMFYIAGTATLSTVSILRLGRVKKRIRHVAPDREVFTPGPESLKKSRSNPLSEKERLDHLETWEEKVPPSRETNFFITNRASTSKPKEVGEQASDPFVEDFQTIVENETTTFIPPNSNMTSTLWSDDNVVQIKHHRRKKGGDYGDEKFLDPSLVEDLQRERSTVENHTIAARL